MSPGPNRIVEAYAGASYPERPLRVFWRGRWQSIAAVEHEERQPQSRCFTVRLAPADGPDDTRLRLCYDYPNDAWSVEPV